MPRSTPILTADMVLFAPGDDEALVLLIQRGKNPYRGRWALPGGYVDPGEQTAAAAVRELAEETGIRLTAALRPVGVYDTPGRDPRGPMVSHAFTARIDRAKKATAGDDAAVARWRSLADVLAEGRLAFDHEQIIRDAAAVYGLH